MEKLVKKFLLLFSFLLLVPLAFALSPPTGGISYYNFSSLTDLWGSSDATNNSAVPSTDYPVYNISGNSGPSSFAFNNPASTYVDLNHRPSTSYSVSMWVKLNTLSGDQGVMTTITNPASSRDGFMIAHHNGLGWLANLWSGNTAVSAMNVGSVTSTTGTWYHLVYTATTTNTSLYFDGELLLTNSGSWSLTHDQDVYNGRGYGSSSTSYELNGNIDEVKTFNRVLNITEVQSLYNNGSLPPAPTPPPPSANQSLESTSTFSQVGVVNVLSTSYVTVVNGTFNVSNATNVYGAYNVEVDNRLSTSISCRSLIDGFELDSEVVRTFDGTNTFANLAIYTTNLSVSSGTHWSAVQCKKNLGTSFFEVSNTNAIVHILHDDRGENISFTSFSNNVTLSSSSYQLLGSVDFNTSDVYLGDNNISLIFEGSINYEYVSESNISFYAEIEGVNTSAYNRYGSANSFGSGAGLYIESDFPANDTVTFNLYGRSSSSDGGAKVNVVIKEFITDVNETDVSSESGTVIGTSWSKVNTLFINNSDHALANTVVKSVNSYRSTSGSQTISLMLGNDVSNGTVMTRNIENNKDGVVYLQDVFQNIGVGEHNFYLWAMTSSGSAVLSNGSTIAYVTDNVPFTSTSYEVRSFDSWDNSSISVFNVTNSLGTIFEATVGVVNVTPFSAFDDLTISSSGYFDAVVLNHNTSDDLNVSLNQSIISFAAFESLSNVSVSGVTFEVTDGVIIMNTTSFLNLKAGSYNVTTYKASYLSTTQSFVVSPLDIKTINVYNMSNANVTIIPRTIISNSSLSGLNITLSYGSAFFYFSNVSNITVPLIANQTYQLMIDGVNISLYNESFSTSSTGDVNEYVYVYYFNSLWVYAFSQDSLVNISSFNVTVQNDAYQYQNSTTSNITYFDNIVSGVYTVLVSSVGYVTNEYTITIDDNAHQDLFAYLANTTNIVTFTVTSKSSSKLVEDALVTQKKFISGVLTTISSAQSNIVGQVSFAYEPDIIYTFVVTKPSFVTKTFTLAPSPIDYTILLETFTTLNPNVFVDDVYTQLFDSNIKNVVSAQVRALFSSGGQLTNYYLNMSFDGDYDYVSSSSATGSLLTSNLNLSGAVIGDVVLVEYGYKSSVNSDYVRFSKSYIINTWSNVDVSFENSRDYFDDYGYLEKVIIATLIAMFFSAIFSIGSGLSSSDMLIGASLGGFFGFGLAFYFGLITGAVFMMVAFIFILIVITNLRGQK